MNHLGRDDAQSRISSLIDGSQPALVSRIGSTEASALSRYKWLKVLRAREKIESLSNFGLIPATTFRSYSNLGKLSGVFPVVSTIIGSFYDIYVKAFQEVTFLGTWNKFEEFFWPDLAPREVTALEHLDPLLSDEPWTKTLLGRKVLVVHPFADTILSQYSNKRRTLFRNPDMLPKFDLTVVPAVQSLNGDSRGFGTWFNALDWMIEESLSEGPDVALVGCGAYGLPLGAALKRAGVTVVHLGGSLQLLFGIMGRRWDSRPHYRALYNDSWVRPASHERPKSWANVDGGVYW